MSQIMYIFRFILAPFHFLWKSSLLSIEKMTKSCAQLVKIDTLSASINHDDQNVFMRRDSEKFEGQQRKSSTHDIFRQSSQKFIQKLRNISLNPMIAKNETAKPTDKPNQTSKDISLARQYSTEPIDRPKLRVSPIPSKSIRISSFIFREY